MPIQDGKEPSHLATKQSQPAPLLIKKNEAEKNRITEEFKWYAKSEGKERAKSKSIN